MDNKIKIIDNVQRWQIFVNIMTTGTDAQRKSVLRTYDINASYTANGQTCLHRACQAANFDLIRFLVERGANIDQQDLQGDTPLIIASTLLPEKTDVVEYLIQQKAVIDVPNIMGLTPLLATSNQRYFSNNFKLLLKAGANPHYKGYKGCSPLYAAAQSGVIEHVRILIEEYQVDIEVETDIGETPLRTACEAHHYDVIEFLLEQGAQVNHLCKNNESALYRLFKKLNDSEKLELRIATLLLQYRADVNQISDCGFTPFALVCRLGKTQLARLFLQHGANLKLAMPRLDSREDSYNMIIHQLIAYPESTRSNRLRILKLLLAHDSTIIHDKTSSDDTALHVACSERFHEAFVMILNIDHLDINSINDEGLTPLVYAVMTESEYMVRKLLSLGADPNIKSKVELRPTALGYAAKKGSLTLIKLLVENNQCVQKTDLNIQTSDGTTPLFFAAQEGHYEVVRYLLEQGADPNIRRKDLQHALFIAHQESQIPEIIHGSQKRRDDYAKIIKAFMDHRFKGKLAKGFDGSYKQAAKVSLPGNWSAFMYEPTFERPEGQEDVDLSSLFSTESEGCPRPSGGQESADSLMQSQSPAQTAYSYLRESGFSHEDIIAMRKTAGMVEEIKLPEEKKEKVNPLWFNGLVTLDQVTEITSGSPNCYFYFDENVLDDADMDEHTKNKFKVVCEKFCTFEGQQGVKHLSSVKPVMRLLEINGEGQDSLIEICAELKIDSAPSRFFCFKINADEPYRQCSLFVAAFFSKQGAHNRSVEELIPQTIKLTIPNPKLDDQAVTEKRRRLNR